MVQNISWKETAYNIVAGTGIKMVQFLFPEYFAKDPVRPTDRYIEYPFVLSNLPLTKKSNPKKILDVGCSGSMFPLLLKALNYDVTGIDIRPYPIKEKINFIQQNICRTYTLKDRFDIITAISTIEHMGLNRYGTAKGSDVEALYNIYGLLKPKGIFLMTVPFGNKYKILKNHRIYNMDYLSYLLKISNFKYNVKIENSPEDKYSIALIRATI